VTRNVRVIQPSDFVRAMPTGEADLAAGERLLAAIAEEAGGLDDFNILVDTRKVTGMLSAGQLWYLAEKFARHPHIGHRRTAVLCSNSRFDHARFFTLCAENKGCCVEPFTSYEDAMEWLLR
jgi:hypothetical protein